MNNSKLKDNNSHISIMATLIRLGLVAVTIAIMATIDLWIPASFDRGIVLSICSSMLAAALFLLLTEPIEKLISRAKGESNDLEEIITMTLNKTYCSKRLVCPDGVIKIFPRRDDPDLIGSADNISDFAESINRAKSQIFVIGSNNVNFLSQRSKDIIRVLKKNKRIKVVFCLLKATDENKKESDWVISYKSNEFEPAKIKKVYQDFYNDVRKIGCKSNLQILDLVKTNTFFTSVVIDDKVIYFSPYVCTKAQNDDPEPQIKVTGSSAIGKAIIRHRDYLLDEVAHSSDCVCEIDIEKWVHKKVMAGH